MLINHKVFYKIILFIISINNICVGDLIRVDNETLGFINERNEQILFRGINFMNKGFPYVPKYDRELVEKIYSQGVNIVRLGFIWKGLMPQLGLIDRNYLVEMKKVIKLLGEYDINVLIDNHQDLWSEQFCGNGAPFDETTYNDFPKPLRNEPYDIDQITLKPTYEDCHNFNWGLYYFTNDVHENFERLFTNIEPFFYQSHFITMWKEIAKSLIGIDNVLGFEIINEPLPGNILKNISLLTPNNANKRLLELYDQISASIREIDSKRIIFFEPVVWTDGDQIMFKSVPGGSEQAGNSVLSVHYYKPFNLNPVKKIKMIEKTSEFLKSGKILSEFYLDIETSDIIADTADEYFVSWIGWSDESLELLDEHYKQLKRIYPIKVCGRLQYFKYDLILKSFIAIYLTRSDCNTNSSKFFIPNNITIDTYSIISECSTKIKIDSMHSRNELTVEHDSICENGTEIILKINT